MICGSPVAMLGRICNARWLADPAFGTAPVPLGSALTGFSDNPAAGAPRRSPSPAVTDCPGWRRQALANSTGETASLIREK